MSSIHSVILACRGRRAPGIGIRILRCKKRFCSAAVFVALLAGMPLVMARGLYEGGQLEAQTLNAALRAFSEQTGLQVIYTAEISEGLMSPGIQHPKTNVEALTQLLSQTALSFKFINHRTVTIFTRVVTDKLVSNPQVPKDVPPKPGRVLVEEVVISGIRYSLARANDIKRHADSVVDVIVAEDIGKFPDTNVAESLQRVTGVSIDRSKGEGRFVSIRGLGPDFVRVTINGRTAPADGVNDPIIENRPTGRAFSFDQLQSEMVSALQVYKSPMASISEGGLGGTVNIVTPRPLDMARTLSIQGAGVYDEFNDGETSPRLSGLYSEKFLDDSVGVVVSAAYFDRGARQDLIDVLGYSSRDFDLNGDTVTDISGDFIGNLRPFIYFDERTRTNFNSTVQWEISDDLALTVDALYTHFDIEENIIGLPFRTDTAIPNATNVEVDGNGTVVRFDSTNSQARSDANDFQIQKDSLILGANLEWVTGALVSKFDISYISNESDDVRKRVAADAVVDLPLSYWADTGSDVPSAVLATPALLNDSNSYGLTFLREDRFYTSDSEFQLKADFEWAVEWGQDFVQIASVDFGLSYQDHEREVDFDRLQVNSPFAGESLTAFARAFPADDFLSSIDGLNTFTDSWATFDVHSVFNHYLGDRLNEIDPAVLANTEAVENDFKVIEENLAAYAQLNFDGEAGETPYRGNVGLRIVRTNQTSLGNLVPIISVDQPTETTVFGELSGIKVKNDYTEILPSANIVFDLTDSYVLRAAVGKVMTRPVLQDLAPGLTKFNPSTAILVKGNPNLKPFIAWQAEISGEWYFDEDAIFSTGFFWKSVDSFINPVTTVAPFVNPNGQSTVDLAGTPLILNTTLPVNEEGATITGFELNFSNQFDSLPAPFDGFGASLNYTFVSSDAAFVNPASGATFDIPGLSRDTFNAVMFYEKGPFSGRVAYNRRSSFLERVAGFSANPEFVDAYSQWDAGMSWDINDRFTLTLEGINITESNVRKYSSVGERMRSVNATGRRFQLGFRALL